MLGLPWWLRRIKNLHTKQETWVLSLGQEDPLEKGKATHSRILAWRMPWTEEPGGLQSIGSQRVGHNWVTNTFMVMWWTSHVALVVRNLPANAGDVRDSDSIPGSGRSPREEMAHTPVFLPGESHGQRSLVGYSPWAHKKSDTTEYLSTYSEVMSSVWLLHNLEFQERACFFFFFFFTSRFSHL